MSPKAETSVGSKGEIYPPKKLREISNLNPGDRIEIEATPGLLIIRKILTPVELLDLPSITSKPQKRRKNFLKKFKKNL